MIIIADILLTNTIDESFVNVDDENNDEHSSATELSTNTCTRYRYPCSETGTLGLLDFAFFDFLRIMLFVGSRQLTDL